MSNTDRFKPGNNSKGICGKWIFSCKMRWLRNSCEHPGSINCRNPKSYKGLKIFRSSTHRSKIFIAKPPVDLHAKASLGNWKAAEPAGQNADFTLPQHLKTCYKINRIWVQLLDSKNTLFECVTSERLWEVCEFFWEFRTNFFRRQNSKFCLKI